MKLRVLSRSFYAVTLALIAAIVFVVFTEESVVAHRGDHDLVLNDTRALAHWTEGGFDYIIVSGTHTSTLPNSWDTDIINAGLHVRNSTWINKLEHNASASNNGVMMGSWSGTVVQHTDCQESGVVGGTEVCTWASTSNGGLDVPVYYDSWRFRPQKKENLTRVRMMFDRADVYIGNTSRTWSKWDDTSGDNTKYLKRVMAHEFSQAAGFFKTLSGSNDLMNPNYSNYFFSQNDRWHINRLYMHSEDAAFACKSNVDMTLSDFRRANGRTYPRQDGQGRVDSFAVICPSTAYAGFAKYWHVDYPNNPSSDDEDFWEDKDGENRRRKINFKATYSTDLLTLYEQDGLDPYKRGSDQTSPRIVTRDTSFQLASDEQNDERRGYRVRIYPDCTYPRILPLRAGHETHQSITPEDVVTNLDSDNDCLSASTGNSYADFYSFTVDQKAFVWVDVESDYGETLSIHPRIRLRKGERTQFGDTPDVLIYNIHNGGQTSIRRISPFRTLEPGAYTAEISTYARGQTGLYDFRVVAKTGMYEYLPPKGMSAGEIWFAPFRSTRPGVGYRSAISNSDIFDFGTSCSAAGVSGAAEKEITLTDGQNIQLIGCNEGTATLSLYDGNTLIDSYEITVTGSITPPDVGTPSNVHIDSGKTTTSIPVDWSSVSHASQYRVEYRKTTASSWTDAPTTTSSRYTLTSLSCGTTYQVRVRAYGDGTNTNAEWGDPSSALSVNTNACLVAPPAPSGVTTGSASRTDVLVNWNSRSGVSAYRVQYRQGNSGSWMTSTSTATGTSYRVTGLACNTSYQFQVLAYGDGTTYRADWGSASGAASARTSTCAVTTLPPAPSGVSTGATTTSSVYVRWNELSGASKYRVEYREGSSGGWTTYSDSVTTLAATVASLSCGTDYQFRVAAYGDGTTYATSWGNSSGSVSVGTDDCVTELPSPPAPSGATAGSPTQTGVYVGWNALSGANKYRVEYRQGSSGSWSVSSDALTSPGHSVTGLNCGQSYQFRVSAYGDGTTYSASWSDPSSTVSESTSVCDTELGNPAAPSGVATGARSRTRIDLSWNAVTGAANYRVEYRRSSSSNWTTASSSISGTSYRVTGLACGRSYRFRVAAYGDGTTRASTWGPNSGEVSRSTRSCSTTPSLPVAPAPGNLTVGTPGVTSVPVSWDAVSGARQYRVQYQAEGGSWRTASSNVTGTTYEVTGLTCRTSYQFRVSAYGDNRTYRTSWGPVSTVATGMTAGCGEPVFAQETYTFTVAEDAAVGTTVGTVSATDPNGQAITYSITAGNDGSKFGIGSSTGTITVAASLAGGGGASGQHDESTTIGPFTLTVQASDGTYTDTATVTINVSSRCVGGGAAPASNPGLVSDCEVLLDLKDNLRGTGTLNWSATLAIASWDGVGINETSNRVTTLNLQNKSLNGYLSSHVGDLSELSYLNISSNRLYSSIPTEIGDLSKLTTLYLGSNLLTGSIPTQLGNLKELRALHLANNYLSGGLPSELSKATKLEEIQLYSNDLEGSIPQEWTKLTNLNSLHLVRNFISGCNPLREESIASNDLARLFLAPCPESYQFNLSGPATVSEGETATYTITSAGKTVRSNITVSYTVLAGSAMIIKDYPNISTGNAVVSAQQTSGTFTVPIIDDNIAEVEEHFSVYITGASGGVTGDTFSVSTTPVVTNINESDPVTVTLTGPGRKWRRDRRPPTP